MIVNDVKVEIGTDLDWEDNSFIPIEDSYFNNTNNWRLERTIIYPDTTTEIEFVQDETYIGDNSVHCKFTGGGRVSISYKNLLDSNLPIYMYYERIFIKTNNASQDFDIRFVFYDNNPNPRPSLGETLNPSETIPENNGWKCYSALQFFSQYIPLSFRIIITATKGKEIDLFIDYPTAVPLEMLPIAWQNITITDILLRDMDILFMYDKPVTITSDNILNVSATKIINITMSEINSSEASVRILADNSALLNILKLYEQDLYWLKLKIYIERKNEYFEIYKTYRINNYSFNKENYIIDIKAYDILYSFNDLKQTIYIQNNTLEKFINIIAKDLIEKNVFYVSPLIKDIELFGQMISSTKIEAIRLLAEATRASVYVDKNGIINLTTIDDSQVFKKINDITSNDIIKQTTNISHNNNYCNTEVEYYTFNKQDEVQVFNGKVELTSSYAKYELDYNVSPVDEIKSVLVLYATDVGHENHDYTFSIWLAGNIGDIAVVSVSGIPYEIVSQTLTAVETTINEEYSVTENYFINKTNAQEIADYYYKYYCRKKIIEFEVLTDNEIDIGNKVSVNYFNEIFSGIVLSTEIEITPDNQTEKIVILNV